MPNMPKSKKRGPKAQREPLGSPIGDLNVRQSHFVREFVLHGNATQAAESAGYSKKTAYSQGQRLLKDARICAEIARLQQAKTAYIETKHEITLERVVAELALIAFANVKDFITVDANGGAVVDLTTLTRNQAAAISEVTSESFKVGKGDTAIPALRTKLKLADKKGALVDLGKHLGGFKTNTVLDTPKTGPLAEFLALVTGHTGSAIPVSPTPAQQPQEAGDDD